MSIALEFSPTGAQLEGMSSPTFAAERFLASLSDSQWRALGSTTGLGQAQLATAEQQRLFRRLIPATASLTFDAPTDLPPDDNGKPARALSLRAGKPSAPTPKRRSRSRRSRQGRACACPSTMTANFYKGSSGRVMLAPEKYLADGDFDPVGIVATRRKPTQLDPASPALDPVVSPTRREDRRRAGFEGSRRRRACR